MKDFFSAFGSEFFRPLATLVLPGAIAITPSIVALYWTLIPFRQFVDGNHAETIGGVVIVCVFVGLVLEDWGSRLETYVDSIHAAQDRGENVHWYNTWRFAFNPPSGRLENEWYSYLRLAFKSEPVGHRYMRTLVLRLKFELGCSVASLAAIISVWFWPITYAVRAGVTCLLLLASLYFCWEASTSIRTLEKLRHELLKAFTAEATTVRQ
jgi:hypothetical protein